MGRYNRSRQAPYNEPNGVFLAAMGAMGILLTLFVLWVVYMIWFKG